MNHLQVEDASILIADDNPENLRVLSIMLGEKGYRVRVAKNGRQALSSIMLSAPDLVLLDIHMPGLDGYEVCRQLKEQEETADIPVIFISALSETFNIIKGFEVGGVDYIVKPFQIEEVQVRIRTHILLRQQSSELKETIRQLRQTQAQLIQSEKLASLGVLISGLAHELNNPMNFIKSSVEPLRRDFERILQMISFIEESVCQGKEKFTNLDNYKRNIEFDSIVREIPQLLHSISEGASRSAEIVRGLEKYSHDNNIVPESLSIEACLDDALTILKSRYLGKIDLRKEYGGMAPYYTARVSLIQVFCSVIENAIDALFSQTNSNGDTKDQKIIIQTTQKIKDGKQYSVVKIIDNGPGMDAETKKRIYDPFFTSREPGQGTGLGLYIAREIVQDMQGFIEVTSDPGQGASFDIWLPYL